MIDELQIWSEARSAAQVLTEAGEANFIISDLGTLPSNDPSLGFGINNA